MTIRQLRTLVAVADTRTFSAAAQVVHVTHAAITSRPYQMPTGMTFRTLATEPMQLIAAMEEPESDPIKLLKMRPFIRFNRTSVVGA